MTRSQIQGSPSSQTCHAQHTVLIEVRENLLRSLLDMTIACSVVLQWQASQKRDGDAINLARLRAPDSIWQWCCSLEHHLPDFALVKSPHAGAPMDRKTQRLICLQAVMSSTCREDNGFPRPHGDTCQVLSSLFENGMLCGQSVVCDSRCSAGA